MSGIAIANILHILTTRRGRGNVVVRLLASRQGDQGSVPGWVNPPPPPSAPPYFRMWESCRTMPLVRGFFSGMSRNPLPLAFLRCSVITSFHPHFKTSMIRAYVQGIAGNCRRAQLQKSPPSHTNTRRDSPLGIMPIPVLRDRTSCVIVLRVFWSSPSPSLGVAGVSGNLLNLNWVSCENHAVPLGRGHCTALKLFASKILGSPPKVPEVPAVRLEHCTRIHSRALNGDGALDVHGSIALIGPALLGLKHGKNIQLGGNLNSNIISY
ncbi:hypothetical protein PR048_031611 [Dryococelus australis]|uniref:Uncharacterized protein n=1 Tax=Dryococelus australis TaxID=614101 RepID=A0ABQ9G8E3_9NEOP|nr:hypothetical protein PR048_031611 [Dryococelus australis]